MCSSEQDCGSVSLLKHHCSNIKLTGTQRLTLNLQILNYFTKFVVYSCSCLRSLIKTVCICMDGRLSFNTETHKNSNDHDHMYFVTCMAQSSKDFSSHKTFPNPSIVLLSLPSLRSHKIEGAEPATMIHNLCQITMDF